MPIVICPRRNHQSCKIYPDRFRSLGPGAFNEQIGTPHNIVDLLEAHLGQIFTHFASKKGKEVDQIVRMAAGIARAVSHPA